MRKFGKYKPFVHRFRKINNYVKPTLFCKDGVIGLNSVKENFRKSLGPLVTSKVSKIIGCTPNYVGYVPSKRIPVNRKFQEFLSKEKSFDDVSIQDLLSERREVWTGGYDSYRYVLNEFCKDKKVYHTASDYIRILEEENFPWIKLPKMPPLNIDDLEILSINPNAHPGFFTKLFFGDCRRDTVKYSIQTARQIYNHLKEKRFKWQGLWTLGGRSKDIKLTVEYSEKVSTRAIWIPEEPLVLLSLLVVQPFTKFLQQIDRNCIFVGKNFSFKENEWMKRLEGIFPFSCRGDWRLFDAHVDSEMILAAMSLIRKCYPEDRFHTRFFSFLTDTIVNKNLVVPPGFVYKISKGIPSGHPLVTLVNTLVNYIVWVTILQKIYGKGRVSENAYGVFSGDDSKFFMKWTENLLNIDEIVRKTTSLECDSIAASIEPSSSKWIHEPNVRFLKRYVARNGLIAWHAPSMLRKLLYTDKKLDSVLVTKRWICSILCAAPGNFKLTDLFRRYIIYMFENNKKDYNDLNKWRIEKEKCLKDLVEAESVGLLSQIATNSIQDTIEKLSMKYIMENNDRKAISRFVNREETLENRVMYVLQGVLTCGGRFSLRCFDRSLIGLGGEILRANKNDLFKLFNNYFFSKFKLDQLLVTLLRFNEVSKTDLPIKNFHVGNLHSEILDFLAEFCRGSKRTKKFIKLRKEILFRLRKSFLGEEFNDKYG